MALGNKKHIKTNLFDWMIHLLTSEEVDMKYIHPELSNLIGPFEHIIKIIYNIYNIYTYNIVQ